MYKYLLCWRYLRTRTIALASIVSVTLGVATMIVVNSVMAGFSHEMKDRLHGILSDLIFEAHGLEGFPDPDAQIDRIRRAGGDDIAGLTPTVTVPAMLSFQYGGNWVTRQVMLIGIDPATQSEASDFGQYLLHPQNRARMAFDLREAGYDTRDPAAGDKGIERKVMSRAGWGHRRYMTEQRRAIQAEFEAAGQHAYPVDPFAPTPETPTATPEGGPGSTDPNAPPNAAQVNPFDAAQPQQGHVFDPMTEQHAGLVLGISLASFRDNSGEDRFFVLPGDDVKLTLPTAGTPPRAVDGLFTVVDLYESKMSEYDSMYVFAPIDHVQKLRGMIDPQTGTRYATSIQIRLRPGADLDAVRDRLRAEFRYEPVAISSWRDKQGALLQAVSLETAILNVLLFMIIAVAGFGILAIFFMIVVEKTRDIGILKSLGASRRGIMGIFLAYGLSLGAVGAGAGLALGLAFVVYINEIADVLGAITGQQVFDPSIYYFYKIPTIIDPFTVTWIVCGALAIAILASVLPARRAAGLHPVEALRYE